MVLAAGHGERMRPLTDRMPKPLVKLAGRPLIDHVLDRLEAAHVEKAIVNVHYLADQIEAHLRSRREPEIVISDERELLLDTGGGAKKALPLLGDGPFFVHNSDSVWSEGVTPALNAMLRQWNPKEMDCLLLLAPLAYEHGLFRQRRFQHGAGRQAGAKRRAAGRARLPLPGCRCATNACLKMRRTDGSR